MTRLPFIGYNYLLMEHEIVLAPEILGYFKGLPITNTLLVSWLVMIVLMAILTQGYGLQGAVIGLVMARLVALPIVAYGCYQNLKS